MLRPLDEIVVLTLQPLVHSTSARGEQSQPRPALQARCRNLTVTLARPLRLRPTNRLTRYASHTYGSFWQRKILTGCHLPTASPIKARLLPSESVLGIAHFLLEQLTPPRALDPIAPS